MDFQALPPEINSGRMYAGPGSVPLLGAAAAWELAAAELSSAAVSYSAVISGLTGKGWRGPSSQSMAAAAAAYVTWIRAAASQAEQSANRARSAASAFEAAFAATVPPPVIAANRAQLAMLIATDILGINLPAIMATEAQYAEMWAQDAAAMYGYAGSSAAVASLTPFPAPQRNTNATGLQSPGAATAGAAGPSVDTIVQQILSDLNNALAPDTVNSGISAFATVPSIVLSACSTLSGSGAAAADSTAAALTRVSAGLSQVATTLGSAGWPQAGGAVSVGLGRAATVGALSVPPAWSASASPNALAARPLPVNLVSETDLGPSAPPIGLASTPISPSTRGGAPGQPPAAEGTTLRSLMRPDVLPRQQYVG
ncbi:PPE family protein [Mycobacterium sp. E2989]|uniref:PPE family protein n=1 Tax=Mycobacterium sp. E2989 TaxID=1834140 RepID=UPI0007FFEC0C|nr:PPE family protein [Mycobacterium sp. E2989]OBH88983.1 hypothetical protein A5680_23130 [Mycobacterium sp. E2989]